ncbi:MAG: VCBS repeat-containing protein [Planctomycetota bacterium]
MRSTISRVLGGAILGSALLSGCTPNTTPHGDSGGATSKPATRIVELEEVETLSEEVANQLVEFSDAVRRRDLEQALTHLTDDFRGTPFEESPPEDRVKVEPLPADTTRLVQTAFSSPVLRTKFLDSVESVLLPLTRIDHVFFKTRGAEFRPDRCNGDVRLTAHILGRGEGGAPFSLYAYAGGAVRRASLDEPWQLASFTLNKVIRLSRPTPLFTDVAAAAGLSVTLPRLGKNGNDKFYWRGAAIGDIDADGRFDLFTSTHDQNYLYRNRGDGNFENNVKSAGIDAPPGSTGPLFFDYDNDGDDDLFLGFVGWVEDGAPGGETLRLYRNDGAGKFEDVSDQVGLSGYLTCAFSSVVADFNNDGWLDIYVCSYERLDKVYPNSWYRATNGNPNLLLENRGGDLFVDVAKTAGVAGTSWSYAAAAADYDGDGDADLYVANDYGDNALYVNNGDGTFADQAEELGVIDTGNGMGATWGDTNGDGRLDLYVANMSSSAGNRILGRLAERSRSPEEAVLFKLAAGNSLFRQKETQGFLSHPSEQGGLGASWAWGVSFLDIDLDAVPDWYIANGFISGDSLKDT